MDVSIKNIIGNTWLAKGKLVILKKIHQIMGIFPVFLTKYIEVILSKVKDLGVFLEY